MKDNDKLIGVIKYICGLIGFLAILFTIFIVTGVVDWFIIEADIKGGALTSQGKLIYALVSSILGILLIFIAFSKQIDSFFKFLETHKVKTDKKEETKGITVESIFFLLIAIILIVLVNLLAIGTLQVKEELPILGKSTQTVLIISLVVLAIFSIITAFHKTVSQSIKEMKKVHWPKGKEMKEYSKQVFTFIIFFSLLFFALDLFLSHIPGKIANWLNL